MKVEVRLTEEQKNLVPHFEKRVAAFQSRWDKRMEDIEERFRLVLHEGSHAVEYHRHWKAQVKNHGPLVEFRDGGGLHFILGRVTRTNHYLPQRYQRAMFCVAGFWAVEYFTGVVQDERAIQYDLEWMRYLLSLPKNADLNEFIALAKAKLDDELQDPNFIPQLEQMCRAYEQDVFGDTSATEWGWRTYVDLKMAAAEIFGPSEERAAS
jgi:hypothetical protein